MGRSASDNNVTPSDVPPYRVLKPRTAASLGKGRHSVEAVRKGGDSAKLAAEPLWLGDVDYTTPLSSNGLVCAFSFLRRNRF